MSKQEVRLGFKGNEKKVVVEPREGTPPWMGVDADLSVIGKDHPRIDAIAKVTGAAKYSYDMRPAGLCYAKLIGSPHAHAKVKSVNLKKARALKGVLFAEAQEGKTVRFAGDDVAGLVAETEEILDDAIRLVEIEYEVLPHAVSVTAARADGAPRVKRKSENTVLPRRGGEWGNLEAAAKAHEGADVVLDRVYRTQVQTHSCLETHGSVCAWNDDKLTVWSSTQSTFGVRRSMATAMRIPQGDVVVITQHMGGGFGSKFGADRWDVFAARASKEIGRPVRCMLDRKAEHLVAGNRPSSTQHCKFSANKDGTLLGAEVHSWGTGGVGGGAGVLNPDIYKFKGAGRKCFNVYTHAGGGRAFRAPRHPQGIFALEGMIDELAEAIEMDPLELRRKNDADPVRLAEYEIGAQKIGWGNRKKSGSGKGPKKRGIGCAASLWYHTGGPGTVVRCRIEKDGSVLVANGAQDLGTGTRTVMAIIAAEELGLEVKSIGVRLGTTTDGFGPGSGGSKTAASIGPAVRNAAYAVKREILATVARDVGGDVDKMDLKNGQVVGSKKPLTFQQACSLFPNGFETDAKATPADFDRDANFAPRVAGCQFAEVEVDTETGQVRVVKVVAVQDCGRVIDPLLARSQLNGGVIQGVSYALFEDRLLDPNTGNMVNPNFVDYKIVGSLDMPEIESVMFPVVNGINSIGMSGLGEPSTVATAGAVGNAVANAIGVRIRSLPITPDKVLAALKGMS
jgi:xanthine dehydrogenase YagR molybdenum-binding subunit